MPLRVALSDLMKVKPDAVLEDLFKELREMPVLDVYLTR